MNYNDDNLVEINDNTNIIEDDADGDAHFVDNNLTNDGYDYLEEVNDRTYVR